MAGCGQVLGTCTGIVEKRNVGTYCPFLKSNGLKLRVETTKLFRIPTYLLLSYYYYIICHLCINCKYSERNRVSKVENFEIIVPLKCMVHAMLFPWVNILFLCFSTFLIMTAFPVWLFSVFP